MEVEKKKFEIEKKDNEIIYSKAIKAGKRIYYLDVKKSRNEDLFLAITESKKKVVGHEEDAQGDAILDGDGDSAGRSSGEHTADRMRRQLLLTTRKGLHGDCDRNRRRFAT